MSAPQMDTIPTPFKTLTDLRAAHAALLEGYNEYEDDQLPDSFVQRIESFLRQAGGSGKLFDVEEDRADAQTLLNYWTTVLYGAGRTPRPTVLAKFDFAAAAQQVGERCPYRGLQAFRAEDRAFFFGRRQLIRDMAESLRDGTFLAVIGLSGSGKSSLVRAGLIPVLQDGTLPGSEDWVYKDPIVPGPDPLRSLTELASGAAEYSEEHRAKFLADDSHLAHLVGDDKTAVVVVDQFEELFTLTTDEREAERRAFVGNLVALTRTPARHRVVVTMRSEFDTYVARYPEFRELFEKAQVRLPPLSPLDLRKAIEKPAERSGLTFEPGLVEELVQQALGEPAGLPLLQFSLYKLWEQRQGKTITWKVYRDFGGSPREVLRSVADTTYESFRTNEDRELSRRIMLSLVRPGAGLDVTSNRLTRAQLRPIGARDNVDRVLGVWEKAGLLRVTRGAQPENDQVEVTHEALIRNWPLLVTWVEAERVKLRKRLQLTSSAQQWNDARRDPGGLLGGVLLAEALAYDDLGDLEKEFVAASQKAADESEREARRQQERLITARKLQMRFATAFLVIAAGLLIVAISRTRAAERAKDQATSVRQELASATYRSKRAAAEAETELMKAQTRLNEAQENLAALKRETNEELARIHEYKETALKWQQMARKSDEDARIAAEKQAKAEREKEAIRAQFNALAGRRPALLLENGRVRNPSEYWTTKLDAHREQIRQTTAAVGRLEPVGSFPMEYLGTVFLAAHDVAIVPSYVVDIVPANVGLRIDFRERADGPEGDEFTAKVIGKIEDDGMSLTILRVEPQSPSGLRLPPPLKLAKDPRLEPTRPLYVVGYPARDRRSPAELMELVFENVFEVKRLQPGELLSFDSSGKFFEYDCLTLGGNSGSPVIDLETGKVLGIHFASLEPASASSAGVKVAYALWRFADHPALVEAGVTFQ